MNSRDCHFVRHTVDREIFRRQKFRMLNLCVNLFSTINNRSTIKVYGGRCMRIKFLTLQ